eukprot:31763_1
MKHSLLLALAIIFRTFDSTNHAVMGLKHKRLQVNDDKHQFISSPTHMHDIGRNPNGIPSNNCPECPFNITVDKIHPITIQSCPSSRITPIANASHHIPSQQAIRCASNTHGIQHYITNECDLITETPSDHHYYVTVVRRRRQLLSSPYHHPNLAEACISYEMIGQRSDCFDSIFLPLCLDPIPSDLTALDINTLIADETFHAGTNIKHAVGLHINGELGISVELMTYDTENTQFKICLRNIIINTDDLTNHSTAVSSIGTSHGMLVNNFKGKESQNTCNIDGIPCFRFFFERPSATCVPNTTNNYNDLERAIASTTHDDLPTAVSSSGVYILCNVIIDLSPSLLYNLWALAIVIVFLNIVIYFCFCLKASSSSCDDSDDDEADISNIIMIV